MRLRFEAGLRQLLGFAAAACSNQAQCLRIMWQKQKRQQIDRPTNDQLRLKMEKKAFSNSNNSEQNFEVLLSINLKERWTCKGHNLFVGQ